MTVLTHPRENMMRLIGRFRPLMFWRRLARLARRSGMSRLFLAFSFDCDTPEDAHVVLDVDQRLRDIGIKPMYAVPGAVLERDAETYRKLLERGAEFLNHGYAQHTHWNESNHSYKSELFYDKLSPEKVKEDVLQGHRTLEKFLGKKPAGFRTPHFGTFQKKKQLRFLHAVLAETGYLYSSSTTPWYAYLYGPAFREFGLIEFPLTGIFSSPMSVQDSWNFFAAPERKRGPEVFFSEAQAMARFCRASGMRGILNFYADPSHIADQPKFFEAVQTWREVAEPVQLADLCSLVKGGNARGGLRR